jgi:DNA-binding NarL/FixJ family response regulator
MGISVLLFDDNDALRESISTLLNISDGVKSVTSFANAQNIASILSEVQADIILMDIDMPEVNGIDALKTIRKTNRDVPVIMLTVFDDNQWVFDAIKAGASGYVLKKDIATKLLTSIDEVLQGGAPMSPTVARMVVASLQSAGPSHHYNLTPREKDILTSLSKGNSFKLIAAGFDISVDTVRTHIKKIYEKLQVHSQTEAVSKAISEKLV